MLNQMQCCAFSIACSLGCLFSMHAHAELNSGPIRVAQANDPFDEFKPKQGAATPRVEPSTSGSIPTQVNSSSGFVPGGQSIGVHCQGNLNRFTGSQRMGTEMFEFRGELSRQDRKFRVINVMKGPLFNTGSSYEVISDANNVATITADSTSTRYVFSTLNLDLMVGKLSGQGNVDFSNERQRVRGLMGRMGLKPSGGASPLGTDGLDGMRKVEVEGACSAI